MPVSKSTKTAGKHKKKESSLPANYLLPVLFFPDLLDVADIILEIFFYREGLDLILLITDYKMISLMTFNADEGLEEQDKINLDFVEQKKDLLLFELQQERKLGMLNYDWRSHSLTFMECAII